MRRTGRWIRRVIVGLVSLIAIVIVGVLFVLHTHWGRELVRERAEAALRGAFPGGATIERRDGSGCGTVTVSNLELDGRDGKRMVFVSSLKFHVELLPLLSGRVRVDSVVLEDVIVDQHPQPPAPPEPEPPSKPSSWTIEVPSIEVHHARVAVTTPRGVVELHDLEADASMSVVRGAISAAVSADGKAGPHTVAARALARYAAGDLAIPFADASLDKAEVTALGAIVKLGGKQPEGAGAVVAYVPAEVAQLFDATLPADVLLAAVARPDGKIDASVLAGGASARVMARADLVKRTGNAFVIADVPDAAALDPRIEGSGIVTAALDLGLDHVRGIVTADGVHPVDKAILDQDTVRATTLVAVDATLTNAWVLIDAGANIAGSEAQVVAELVRDPKTGAVDLTTSTVAATAHRIALEGSDASVGYVAANVRATGRILPSPHLHVSGTLDAQQLRQGTFGAAALHFRIDDLVRVPSIASTGHLDLTGITRGGAPFGAASIDVQGAVGTDGTIGIDLGPHNLTTAANGVWSGSGGHISIEPATITVRDVRTGNGNGKITASATYGRLTKNLTAKLDAHDVALGALVTVARGTLGGTLSIARRGGQWSGDGKFHGAQLAMTDKAAEGRPPLDVDVDLHVAGREITGTVAATSTLGGATVAVDVHGPVELTDVDAWRRLDRKALRDASVQLAHIDLSNLGTAGREWRGADSLRPPGLTGVIDGKLDITGSGASGTITATGFETKHGNIDGQLSIAPKGNDIQATVKGTLVGVDAVDAIADLELPARLFDPVAWRTLGKKVLRGATIHLEPAALDQAMLAKLGVLVPYRGHVEASATVGVGAETATATLDVRGVEGGVIRKPIDLHVEAGIAGDGLTVNATTSTGKATLVTATAHAPVTIDNLATAKLAKLDGSIDIPMIEAKDVVALFGRADVNGGTIDGTIKIGGTVGIPTAQAKIEARDITIPASASGKVPARLDFLGVDGTWSGTSGQLDVTGTESGGGSLKVTARGRPDQLAALTAQVEADKLDIAPFAALAPGVVSGARGTVDAFLILKGLDPDTGDVHGTLDIHQARLPLSAVLGTLRQGEVAVTVADHQVVATIDGKLGKGDVKGKATAVLVGSTPSKVNLDLSLRQISLIQAHQPVIDAAVTGKLAFQSSQWTGDLVIDQAHVSVPSAGGAKLLESSAPSDMVFVDVAPATRLSLLQRPPPDRPWLIVGIELKPTTVDVSQDEFQVHGGISGKVTVSLGQGEVGLDGTIDADRGDIDLLGTRSKLEHGSVTFDGTLDPLLNARVIRDLTDFTISADISGRLSKPIIELSSDSGSYTQLDLVGFFLGGEPSADLSAAGQGAAAGGAGLASALVSKRLNTFLPVKVNVNYETATSTSSEAVRVGHWINRHLYVAAQSHIDVRPDENANEAVGEYHFQGNTLIQGSYGDRGYSGLDLVHRWHW